MASVAVAIMARQPVPGSVKTRLRPHLTDHDIAVLYDSFLRDRIAQVRALHGAAPVIAYTPAESRPFFAEMAPDFLLLPQAGNGLSARLTCIFRELLEMGYDGVIATDSDSPTLPTENLQGAVDRLTLNSADMVLGPSDDGGYYLVGLRRLPAALFDGMQWSTPLVYDETLRRAAELGARVASLPGWYDVDTPVEFERLRAELHELGAAAPRHTRRFFAEREPGSGRSA
jgi:rSAM/selenodomain-associated transferase 1